MEKIFINKEENYKSIMQRYGVSKATAYLAKKRGYIIPNYHAVKEDYTAESIKKFEVIYNECKEYSFALLMKYYPHWDRFHEDWVSDAILKGLLKSNKVNNPAYIAKIALSFARDYEKSKEAQCVISYEYEL